MQVLAGTASPHRAQGYDKPFIFLTIHNLLTVRIAHNTITMTNSEYTAGPWEQSINEDSREIVVRQKYDGRIIANLECDRYHLSDEEIADNARLIAASPELYQMILKIDQRIDHKNPHVTGLQITNLWPEVLELIQRVKRGTE